jgi:hypothetical protein
MARSIVIVLGLTLSFSACAQIPAPADAAPPPVADAPTYCDAGKASSVVGQLPTPETQERARTHAGAEVVRALRHDQPVTEEFRANRLNLMLNAKGRIASVHCG